MNTICSQSETIDQLKLGKNIVIHPFVSIKGPIIIEDGCIIEEKTSLINNNSRPMRIGAYSHLQVGSTVIDSNIGSYCILQPKAFIHSMNIGDHCIISAKSNLYGPDKTPSNTLVLNGTFIKKQQVELDHELRLEYLHAILPKCHETFGNDESN